MFRMTVSAPVFTKITKDTSAKFVDKMSVVGGTFGLLTGFSLISGVEILYFAVRMIKKILKKFILKQ